MKVDLGVLSTTIDDYDEVITKLEEIKGEIKDTESELSDKGWTGEAQKKYTELIKWFIDKDYACLEDNLKCIKEVLSDEARSQGGALKNRCEDFVNCFDGSERGAYPEGNGESVGILSLEYDNSASVIDNVTEITNKLISQKRAALNDLSKTIKGGWFSSGLIFSSLNIDNELAESSNEIFNEEKRLNAFLQSFVQYTPGVKRLEETVCSGLNKVKDLQTTVEQNIQTINYVANMSIGEKALGILKTVSIDVVGGAVTFAGGVCVVTGGVAFTGLSGGVSDVTVPEGVAMIGSGANCAYNGGWDLYREITGDWVDVGSTNFVKDGVTNMSKSYFSDKNANLIGSGVTIVVDGVGNTRGIIKTVVTIPGQAVNVGKDAISVVKEIPNLSQKIISPYKGGSVYYLSNPMTQFASLDKVRTFPITNISYAGVVNGTYKVATGTYAIGKTVYGDENAYYNTKTILGDGNINLDPEQYAKNVLGIQGKNIPNDVKLWLETDTRGN